MSEGSNFAEPQPVASVEFQITEKDILTYQGYRLWHEPAGRRRLLGDWALGTLGYVGLVLAVQLIMGGIHLETLALALVMLAGVQPLLSWRGRVHEVRRQMAEQPAFGEKRTLFLTVQGCCALGKGFEIRRSWGSVREIVSTLDHLYLMLDDIHAIVVPRRAFTSPAAAEKFASVARELQKVAREAPEPEATPAALEALLGPERLEVEYDLTERDYARYGWYSVRRNRPLLLRVAIYGVALGGLLGFMGGPAIGALAAGAYLVYVFGVGPWNARRTLRHLPGMLGRQRLALSSRALWGWAPGMGEGIEDWTAVTEVTATAEQILLLRGKGFPIIIPKRSFPGPEAADRFLLRACEWHAVHVAHPSKERNGSP